MAFDLRRARPPLSVIVLAAVVVAVLLALLVFGRVDAWLIGGAAVLLLGAFGVVRGMWLAWLFLLVVTIGDLLVALANWPAWWSAAINVTLLLLLLVPSTRRHVRRAPPPLRSAA